MTTPPRLLAGRMPEASTPSRRYRCAASSLTACSLRARVRHEARRFSVRNTSDETQRQHPSTTDGLRLEFAAELFKESGPPLNPKAESTAFADQTQRAFASRRVKRYAKARSSREPPPTGSRTMSGGGSILDADRGSVLGAD